jgi:hypothetical protein
MAGWLQYGWPMLTAQLYPEMKDGPSLLVSGALFVDGHWHVSVWLHPRVDGSWRVGRETDSEIYVLNHVHASVPPRAGCHRVATKGQRRELLRQIYEWIDAQTGTARDRQDRAKVVPATSNSTESNTMSDNNKVQCSVYTKRGKGPRCPNPALEGRDVCKLHVYLIGKLGELPREAVVPVEAAPLEAPTAAEPIAVEPPKKTRKPRSDKGSHRRKRS